MINNYSPVALFVYNRFAHTHKTIEALKNNVIARQTDLIIFSDAPKSKAHSESVAEVRQYIHQINGFNSVSIIERETNFGLANSIIAGVTTVVNQYGTVIVLEDDLITSPYFLTFMNNGLEIYQNSREVASIHGYIYPIDNLPEVFFIKGADCWGWATWKRAWDIFEADGNKLLTELYHKKRQKEADFNNNQGYTQMLKAQINGQNDSWAVRWYMSAFLNNMFTLYPSQSYVQNIGLDNSGTHCTETEIFSIELTKNSGQFKKVDIKEDKIARLKIEYFFKSIKPSLLSKIISKITITKIKSFKL
jgi:hypothetical protein